MTEERHQNGHDQDETRISKRYRGSSTEQPPAALDARILAAARESVATPPAARPTWRPVAVAAVVLLSATLVITMRPPGDEAGAPASVAAVDAAEPETTRPIPQPAAAPSRRMATETAESEAAEEIVVTGNRVVADEDADLARVAGKAVAQAAGRERRGPAAEAAPPPADAAIEAILAAWEAGDTTEAMQLLDTFADDYPEFAESDLREALPGALFEDWRRQ